jgi:hypothetical protein
MAISEEYNGLLEFLFSKQGKDTFVTYSESVAVGLHIQSLSDNQILQEGTKLLATVLRITYN